MRLTIGMIIGSMLVPIVLLEAEMCPAWARGRLLLLGFMTTVIGQIYATFGAWLFTPDLEGKDWKMVCLIATIPIVPSLVFLC